jgi:hypothetical protein
MLARPLPPLSNTVATRVAWTREFPEAHWEFKLTVLEEKVREILRLQVVHLPRAPRFKTSAFRKVKLQNLFLKALVRREMATAAGVSRTNAMRTTITV